MKQFLFGVVLGALLFYVISGMFDKDAPEAISIERGGKVVGYFETAMDRAEFVNVRNAKSPGMFVAFPIFGDKDQIQQALS